MFKVQIQPEPTADGRRECITNVLESFTNELTMNFLFPPMTGEKTYFRSFFSFAIFCLFLATKCKAAECAVKPEARVLVNGEVVVVEEPRFPKHYSYYPPKEQDDDQPYYILNDKPLLYVPSFLNQSIAEELKTFCLSGERFVQSHIRGNGDASNVEKHEIRTR
jgi:hypothetical protein